MRPRAAAVCQRPPHVADVEATGGHRAVQGLYVAREHADREEGGRLAIFTRRGERTKDARQVRACRDSRRGPSAWTKTTHWLLCRRLLLAVRGRAWDTGIPYTTAPREPAEKGELAALRRLAGFLVFLT